MIGRTTRIKGGNEDAVLWYSLPISSPADEEEMILAANNVPQPTKIIDLQTMSCQRL